MDQFRSYGEYNYSDKKSASTAIGFLLVGLGVGAITALLMAPKTGMQMRKAMRRRFEDARDQMGERMNDWRDRASEAWEHREEWAENAKSKVQPFMRRARSSDW